ncbi:MAG: Stf0 family sulfotransferase [Planctomycetota bacterium]
MAEDQLDGANPDRRFLIVGMQRSGTTVTYAAVQSHPEVACPSDEIEVDPFFTRGLATFMSKGQETFDARRSGIRRLFDVLANPQGFTDRKTRGFKVALGGYEVALALTAALIEHFPEASVVIVQREDLVAQFGSMQRAKQSGIWHTSDSKSSDMDARVKVDRKAFAQYVEGAARISAVWRFLESTHRCLRIHYEEHIDGGFQHERLFEFLGVDVVDPTWLRMKKVSPSPDSYIQDYDKLRKEQRRIEESVTVDVGADLLAYARRQADQETSRFLATRAAQRLTNGSIGPARIDLEAILGRQDSLADWLAGSIDVLCDHAGFEEGARRDHFGGLAGNPVFHVHAAREELSLGHPVRALARLVVGFDRAADSAEDWWVGFARSVYGELAGQPSGFADSGVQAALEGSTIGRAVLLAIHASATRDDSGLRASLAEITKAAPSVAASLAKRLENA